MLTDSPHKEQHTPVNVTGLFVERKTCVAGTAKAAIAPARTTQVAAARNITLLLLVLENALIFLLL
jgi:hypothetical protein